jgi:hypothetical protein
MTGPGRNDDIIDEQLFDAIQDAYRDVWMPVAVADIQRRSRRGGAWMRPTMRLRVALAAAAVVLVTVATWALIGPGGSGGTSSPGEPTSSAPPTRVGKPARPTSTASTDIGRCADYLRAELDPSRAGQAPPLRLSLDLDRTRLLVYATDDFAVTCWLSGELFAIGGSPTAVDDGRYPADQLSYRSEDSGREWGGVAFGRAPPGTTEVTISFPTGPDVTATMVGEWYGYLAPPGPESHRLTTATRVTAVTGTGNVTRVIQHG